MPSDQPPNAPVPRTRLPDRRSMPAAVNAPPPVKRVLTVAERQHDAEPTTPVPRDLRQPTDLLPIDLVRATVADAARLATIHAAAFSAAEAWSRDVFSLQLALPNVSGLLQLDKGLILVRVAGAEAEILTLAVVPEARRHGIATALLRRAVVLLATAGASVVFLEVSVKNTAGLALYLQNGFTHAGLRRAYYSDRSDALVLRLNLPELG